MRGSAIAFALVIMTSVAILLSSILVFISSQIRNSSSVAAKEESLQIAEAGIHFYRWYLAHEVEGLTTQQVEDFWTNGSPYGVGSAYEEDYSDPATGSAIGRYRLEVTPSGSGSTSVTVRATGWTFKYPGSTRTIEVRLRRPAWSEWAALANDDMRFGAGTEVFGKIHSNEGIRFDGFAHNVVTSSLASYDDPDHGGGNEFGVHTHVNPVDPLPPTAVPLRQDVFGGGRQFPVVAKDFNGVLGDFSYIKSVAVAGTSGSLYFNNSHQGRRIILRADGTFSIRTVRSFNANTNGILNYDGGWATYNIPDGGVIFVENNVWLEGTVSDRRVTIVAANLLSSAIKSVYIGNDIRYTYYDGRDVIGILAQNDVEIIEDSENDLRIDAALVAARGRVGRDYYGAGDHRSVITVYGAIVTNERYGFAYTNGAGYATRNLYYDNELLYGPPPYFPVDSRYVIDLWEEL